MTKLTQELLIRQCKEKNSRLDLLKITVARDYDVSISFIDNDHIIRYLMEIMVLYDMIKPNEFFKFVYSIKQHMTTTTTTKDNQYIGESFSKALLDICIDMIDLFDFEKASLDNMT